MDDEAQPPDGAIAITEAEALKLWTDAWTPRDVAERLAGVTAPWCVAGGWAVDLFRGEQSREHSDIEIGVPANRFPEVRDCFSVADYEFDAIGDACLWSPATPESMAVTHQTWLRHRASGQYRLDVFREPHDGDVWICRRDPSIRLPYAEVVHRTPDGIPYLAPELVLLFKAKAVRPKDQRDFDATVLLLGAEQRAALAGWLELVHPGHAWLDAL